MKTVNEMYNYTASQEMPLLSDANYPFWQEYASNYKSFDNSFRRLFFSYKYFLQDPNDSIEVVTANFIKEVKDILILNNKKYSELYRIYTIDDDDYNFLDNYDMTEKMDRTDINDFGQRVDSATTTMGERHDSTTAKVSPDDITSFKNKVQDSITTGSQTNTDSTTKGAQLNSETEVYTLSRKGNIGVQTSTDMIGKFETYWKAFEFYKLIFIDIAAELLMI